MNELRIVLKNPETAERIALVNSIGHVVHQIQKDNIHKENIIRVNEVGSGLYIISIQDQRGNRSVKVIKK